SCWVCFATDEDDRTAEWVRPCRCRGSTKWVHQACLQRWVDEKQRGNSTARVACPQCNAEYLIVFPKLGPVVYVLDLADRLISKACPFAAAGIMVGSIYWTAVTYGAVTVMQVHHSTLFSDTAFDVKGGIAFVAIKGAFKVYFKQQQYLRQAHRKILNYPEQEEA
ncbi:hypothetical protein A6R68_12388, partial [Neotoma lepida]